MKNILIFKTDRLGDLLNISPVISNIKSNYPDSNITLICSKNNNYLAKYYKNDLKIIVYRYPLIFFLIQNFKLLKNKFDIILQLDGKNHSYFLSSILRADKKACIKFIKKKKFFKIPILISRPNFIIRTFFHFHEVSYEDYSLNNNHKYHYLSLYLNLIKKMNINIISKDHYLPFVNPKNVSNFKEGYFLFHIDKRWEAFEINVKNKLKDKILSLSKKNCVVITSDFGGNHIFDFINNELNNLTNIQIIEKPNLDNLISLIYFSKTCISSHSGLIVHAGSAFKKNIIDLVSPDINNELDRWIPFNINYNRFDINNFNDANFII